MEHNNSNSLNILFNNNLASDSWNKRMSCEQCEPIKSPSDSRHDVVTLKSMSNKIFIFSYEDNAPLVDNKEYLFSISTSNYECFAIFKRIKPILFKV